MKVIFSGGGTLGPAAPLLAIYEVIKERYPSAEFIWIGTKNGPEKRLIEENGIKFIPIPSGKFRRYISIWNIIDFFKVIAAFFISLKIIKKQKPDICISAGGFVSVPLHFAARVLKVGAWIHQQDARVGLSNIVMAPFAEKITVALEKNIKRFPKYKTKWLGNPVRQSVLMGTFENAVRQFSLVSGKPIIFAMGGGTGSLAVNRLVSEAAGDLCDIAQIIHLTGKGRGDNFARRAAKDLKNYHVFQFFTEEMKDAYAAADIVVSRGGFATLTEAAAFRKPVILVPKSGQQEENAKFLSDEGAAVVLNEKKSNGKDLACLVKSLLDNNAKRALMGERLNELLPRAKKEDILDIIDCLRQH